MTRRISASPLAYFLQQPTGVVVVSTRQRGCLFIEMDDDNDYEVYGFSIDPLKFTSQYDVMNYCGDFTMIETLNQETYEQKTVWSH